MEPKIVKTIDEIGKESIDSIADNGFFTYGYFKTLETLNTFNIAPIYLSFFDLDSIVAVVPCYRSCISDSAGVNLWLNAVPAMRGLAKIVSRLNLNHQLVLHSPGSHYSKILLVENCTRKEILYLVLRKIDKLCRSERILVSSFSHVSEFDGLLLENLQDYGYIKFPLEDTVYLNVQWSSFDEYLESLCSKTRKKIKREVRLCRENGIVIAEEDRFENLQNTLSKLYSNVHSRYDKRAGAKGIESPFPAPFFGELSKYARDKTLLFTAKRNNVVVGFSLCLLHKGILDVYLCGYDYDNLTNNDFAHFNMVFYTPIKFAIEEGIRRINFGGVGENALWGEAKLHRGFRLEKKCSFVKCHNRILKPLINLYLRKK